MKKLLAALLVATSAFPVYATPIIDKDNSGLLNDSFCTGNICQWQQTVTAGLTGKLTGLTLFGSGTGELRIALGGGYHGSGWVADLTAIPIDGTTIDLSSYNIYLTAGQQFVFDVSNTTGILQGTYNNTVFGQLYLNAPAYGYYGAAFGNYYGEQLGFVTYVDAATDVPEPAMLGLFGLGAIGLGLSRRRKA